MPASNANEGVFKKSLGTLTVITTICGFIKSIGELNTTIPAATATVKSAANVDWWSGLVLVVTYVGEFTWAMIWAALSSFLLLALIFPGPHEKEKWKRIWRIWTIASTALAIFLWATTRAEWARAPSMISFFRVLGTIDLTVMIGFIIFGLMRPHRVA